MDNIVPERFGATNGVKQGFVLSTILFTFSLDDLFEELWDNGDDCLTLGHILK